MSRPITPASAAVWPRNQVRNQKSPKLPIREVLTMVRALRTKPRSREELLRLTDVSRATFWRLLADAERELGIVIECEDGMYSILNWGIIDPGKL